MAEHGKPDFDLFYDAPPLQYFPVQKGAASLKIFFF